MSAWCSTYCPHIKDSPNTHAIHCIATDYNAGLFQPIFKFVIFHQHHTCPKIIGNGLLVCIFYFNISWAAPIGQCIINANVTKPKQNQKKKKCTGTRKNDNLVTMRVKRQGKKESKRNKNPNIWVLYRKKCTLDCLKELFGVCEPHIYKRIYSSTWFPAQDTQKNKPCIKNIARSAKLFLWMSYLSVFTREFSIEKKTNRPFAIIYLKGTDMQIYTHTTTVCDWTGKSRCDFLLCGRYIGELRSDG